AVNNAKFFKLTLKSVIIAALLTVVLFYVNPNIDIAPKTNLIIFIVVFSLFFWLWRRIFNWSLNSYLPKDNIAFIGWNEKTRELIEALKAKPHLGFNIKLLFSAQPKLLIDSKEIPVISDFKKIKQSIIANHIVTLVVAGDLYQSEDLRSALFSCLPLKLNFISLPQFYEQITGKVPIDEINQMWFLENLSEGRKTWFDSTKRFYDFALALIILLLTAIFWPLIGLIIKLESKGPIFFKQTRTGKNNIPFTIIKFRTMTEEKNDRSPTEDNDVRITKLGTLLRKTRIDELPQIINILLGSMSFIGPRPERPELIAELRNHVPFYEERMLVKPGLTGWDQVSGEYHSPSRSDTLKKLQYDLFYIKNRSIYLDISIALKTIATVFKSYGK
ncbi:exopolysaccharide biosynthesis polyprenyl glycosylphosphotransferase, partial [bacterium]|nr:exopolysaccharide biosynthesis polyprenyl glycosylphosphotransferase [bacterium]